MEANSLVTESVKDIPKMPQSHILAPTLNSASGNAIELDMCFLGSQHHSFTA